MNENEKIPNGYRQAVVTAITVFLGFSMTFLRFWGIEVKGGWTLLGFLAEFIIGIGVVLQVAALFRALDVDDDNLKIYKRTISLFRVAVAVVIVGVIFSIFAAA
jgi:uncharacterized membrane protein YidH (DUF202 family)